MTTDQENDPAGYPVDFVIHALQQARQPLLFVVSGPSGAGKDTVVRAVDLAAHQINRVVTATTRPPRDGELQGREYHFLDLATFEEWQRAGEFIEFSQVYDNYYGVPRFSILDGMESGEDQLVTVDVQGAAKVRQWLPAAVLIFLAPGSASELELNLTGRNSDDAASLAIRMAKAAYEMDQASTFDYVVFNHRGQLSAAVEQLSCIIEAERCRINRPSGTN